MFAEVAVPPLDHLLTYRVPVGFSVAIGDRVSVPLGTRTTSGFVIAIHEFQPEKLSAAPKEIFTTPLSQPMFPENFLWFFQWVADYYGEPLSKVIDTAIPPDVPEKPERMISLVHSKEILNKKSGEIVAWLKDRKNLASYKELSQRFLNVSSIVRSLKEKGIIEEHLAPEKLLFETSPLPDWVKQAVTLTAPQHNALQHITAHLGEKRYSPFLLHGETGSGKTEVYIEAARKVLALNQSVIVLVPEIALTPQLIDRFRGRLGNNIALLHSGLTPRTRWHSWRAIIEKQTMIAIGARSAIFAPLPNLGLIIVDEEHDGSYKQSEGLRYHARDLSLLRGQREKCPVILGSATPSLETFHQAEQGIVHYLSLPATSTHHQALPIEVIDLTRIHSKQMASSHISPSLREAIESTINRNEQVLLLYNRRGFASFLQCSGCGDSIMCPHCSVTLTYHRTNHSLVCHYCNFQMMPPLICNTCPPNEEGESHRFIERGAGTEKIVDELKNLFPKAKIDRLDRDAVTTLEAYKGVLNRIRSGETNLLVGTQMIAKGHDLPSVTLVGIVNADIGLHMPDFRASERAFQLLTQAAGRAGRGDLPGVVKLQTRLPEHPSVVATIARDYRSFAQPELHAREALGYPPFKKLLRIIALSEEETDGMNLLSEFKKFLEEEKHKPLIESVALLGPAPCPITKIKRNFRHHLLLKGSKASDLIRIMRVLKHAQWPKRVKVQFDVDPQDML